MNIFNISLTKRYIPAVIIIGLFIVITNILNSSAISSNEEYGKIINISGKQRMLSQKLVILGINYISSRHNESKTKLKNTLAEIESSHKYLLTKIFTDKLQTIYYDQYLDRDLTIYISYFRQLLKSNDERYLVLARKSSDDILKKLDKAVKEYERYGKHELETLANYEFYLMLATLVMLLIEVIFIFRPAARQIEKDTIAIHDEKEYKKTIIESNNNAIIAIDWTAKITTYNKKAQEMFGWTQDEMIDTRNLLYIIPDRYKKLHTNASKNYLSTGKSCGILGSSHELEAIRKDGTIFPILISFGAQYKIENTVVVANISDITIQKRHESKLQVSNEELEQKIEERTKELQQLNENLENLVKEKTIQNTKQLEMLQQQSKMAAMGEMIGAIAHQWRQPLNVISTGIQNLKYDYRDGNLNNEHFIKEFIDKNKITIKFMSKTIDDFRSFFRIDKDQIDFKIKVTTESIINIQQAQLKNYNITLNITGDEFVYTGLQSEYQQVILNLVSNAKDALMENKIEEPTININIDAKTQTIQIKDNAGGIPMSVIDRVFEPYFTTKEQGKGTGMGLYMSKMIIEDNMGGEINVENIDDGAAFCICFSQKKRDKK